VTFDPNDENYKRAQKHIKDIQGFYRHLSVYLTVAFFVFLIDLITGGNWWFYWGAIGWGALVTIHGLFTLPYYNSGDWEERKIRELMEKQGLKPKHSLPDQEEFFERTSDV
jgi:hypothetical protein